MGSVPGSVIGLNWYVFVVHITVCILMRQKFDELPTLFCKLQSCPLYYSLGLGKICRVHFFSVSKLNVV